MSQVTHSHAPRRGMRLRALAPAGGFKHADVRL